MSIKTLRPSNDSAMVLTTNRSVRQRVRAIAYAVAMLMSSPAPSVALELGDAAIRSSLGQTLLVEIPYRLAADERLTPACIGLAAPRRDAALPAYSRLSRIGITPTHIEIFGDSRVLEPLIGLTVDVHCATAPHFVRSYQLFVDPPARIPALPANGTQLAATPPAAAPTATFTPIVVRRNASDAPRANVSARARGATGGTLTQGQTYVVVRGDTLSGIAARIGDRPTIREAADAVFAANPQAFVRGNRDLIEAGRSITIPLMTAATVAPPPAPATPVLPVVREAAPLTPSPSADVLPVSRSEPSAPSAAAPPRVAVPEQQPSAADVVVDQPSSEPAPRTDSTAVTVERPSEAPARTVRDVAPEPVLAEPPARTSLWLTALLALGVALVLSTPLLFIRRRKQEAAAQDAAKPRPSQPRRLVDPVAGIEVVEGQLARAPSRSSDKPASWARPQVEPINSRAAVSATPDALTFDIGPTDSVDLDVGAPVTMEERVDWFGDRVDAAAAAKPAATSETVDDAATARMPDLLSPASLGQLPVAPQAAVEEATINDEQHTLTIVELDMLRQDYEAERTLTQAANKALRDAVADLRATQATQAAGADTATLEMPQQSQAETIETQPTQKLRSSR